jgi:hypothetical protein
MDINQLYEILKNEYNSGTFFIENNMIGWYYASNGVDNPEDAEDRWLSFLGAKITAQNIIEGTDYVIFQKFERNNKIGFFIKEDKKLKKIVKSEKPIIFNKIF